MPMKVVGGKIYDTDKARRVCLLQVTPAVALYVTARGAYFKCPDMRDRTWSRTLEWWLEPLTREAAMKEVLDNINDVCEGRAVLKREFGLEVEDA